MIIVLSILKINMSKTIQYDTLQEVVKYIYSHFFGLDKEMILMYFYKTDDKQYLFSYLEGLLPSQLFIGSEVENSIQFFANWNSPESDNKNNYNFLDDEDNEEEIEKISKAYKKVSYYTKNVDYKYNDTTSYMSLLFSDINQVDIYENGFCVFTDTPIDFIFINKECIDTLSQLIPLIGEASKDKWWREINQAMAGDLKWQGNYIEYNFLKELLGSELSKIKESFRKRYLIACWDRIEKSRISDEKMDKILGGQREETSDGIGQSGKKFMTLD